MKHDFKYEGHKYIELFIEAGGYSKCSIAMANFSDVQLPKVLSSPFLGHRLTNLANPVGLAAQLRHYRHRDVIFVREFLTIPLLIAAPVLWRYRKNTLFVLNHNTQTALSRRRDRMALSSLFALGFKFVALESDAGLRMLGLGSDRRQVLTLPLAHYSGVPLDSKKRDSRRPVVGVVGRMRPEKKISELFNVLDRATRSHDIDVEVLVGCDDRNVLNEAATRGFRTLDTTTLENYDGALRLCDVVLLNYDADRYLYRASATIADAIFRGIGVVCPDYPIFLAQVSVPSRVGATFGSLAQLPTAIKEALDLTFGNPQPFQEYIRHRQAQSLATMIDGWMERAQDNSADR